MPRNISLALNQIKHMNLMPVYGKFLLIKCIIYLTPIYILKIFLGLNVYSMLKYETLVLTVAAVKKIQERLLYQLHRPDGHQATKKFMLNKQN